MNDPEESKRGYVLSHCLPCDGHDYACPHYAGVNIPDNALDCLLKRGETCLWYQIVSKDLEKLSQGRHDLTFSELEVLVDGEPND